MSEYVFLYRGGSAPEDEAERRKAFDAWTAWFERLGTSVKDPGNPFVPAAKQIRPGGAVSDAPATDAVGGYSIVSADSIDEALAIAKDSPALDAGSTITVHEVAPVM
jgi:hypothetical protein